MTTIEFDRNQTLRQALLPGAGCPPLAELLETLFAGATTPEPRRCAPMRPPVPGLHRRARARRSVRRLTAQ